MKIVLGILLFLYGIWDIKERKIALFALLFGILITCVLRISLYQISWSALLLGCIPGAAILLLGKATKGEIGAADGCILLMTGIGCGFSDNVILLFYAACLSAIVSLFLLGMKKGNRKTELPFIPFLFLGYLGVVL